MAQQRYVSDTLKKKKKKVKKLKLYFILFLLTLFLVGLLYLLQIKQMQIQEVVISGNSFVTTEEITRKVDTQRNQKILWFIPRNNIFIFSKNAAINDIKKDPAIISASIQKDYFQRIKVTVEEQEKEALYCDSFERTNCFFVNSEGFIYAHVEDFFVPEEEIILYRAFDQKVIGDMVYKEDLHNSVMTFIKSSARFGIRLTHSYLRDDDVLELYTLSGTRLLTSRYDDFEKDFSNFVALFEQDVLTKEGLENIDYIDLRFGNKVFYKNKIY